VGEWVVWVVGVEDGVMCRIFEGLYGRCVSLLLTHAYMRTRPQTSILVYIHTQEEAMAASAKPKVKKAGGKGGKGNNDLKELEAQLAAMEMEKKKKAEKAKAEKAAAAKVLVVGGWWVVM
jgi:cation transport regulator ChaC